MAGKSETNGSAESMRRLAEENAQLRASVAELRDRMTQLEALADTDPLTPLPNRRRFIRELERAVAQASRHATPAAMLYVDLDSLKTINDRHGHFAGDAALVHVAKLLSGLIRSTDIAARIGGDEFALLLDHLDLESAIDTAERIARCISSTPLDLGGTLIELQASIGTAAILAGDSVEDVMQRADRNMYVAKAAA
jgi:diguanylate cyclase (GGDEF)-like protein